MNNNTHTKNITTESISDFVIHLGAGMGISTPLYQQLGYKRLVLAEVSLELVNILQKKFSQNANVTVRQMAVSAKDESINFNCYSKSRYSSQLELEPEFLKNSDLQFLEQVAIHATPLIQLITELKLAEFHNNALIVELNGYESQFLSALSLSDISCFSRIFVSLQATNRYINQTNQATLCTALNSKGFRLTARESNQFIFTKDEQLIANLQSQAQQATTIENMKREQEVLRMESLALNRALSQITQERNELETSNLKIAESIDLMQRQIENYKTEASKNAETLQVIVQEREELMHLNRKNGETIELLQKTVESQNSKIIKIVDDLNRMTQERDKILDQNESLNQSFQKQKQEVDSLNNQIEQYKLEVSQEYKKQIETLQRQRDTMKKDLVDRERSQDLALKLQAKAQVDLSNLQAQFQHKMINEQKLIALINELQIKLRLAANHYHQLQLKHPEINIDRPGSGAKREESTLTITDTTFDDEFEAPQQIRKTKISRSKKIKG
jgi:FkbM family methyltransferase